MIYLSVKIKKEAFTLIETLVYSAVLGILIFVLSSFLIWSSRSNIKIRVMRETLDNTRQALELMNYEIRGASSVYTSTTTSNQLSLETTKYLPEGEASSYIDFFLCGNRLCLKRESQDPITLTSENIIINNLVFTQVNSGGGPSIEIELSAGYNNPANRPEYEAAVSLDSVASLRTY